jgi:hypothetical protein
LEIHYKFLARYSRKCLADNGRMNPFQNIFN